MSARPILNRAYLMIGVAAIIMLATLLGGLALQRRQAREKTKPVAPTVSHNQPL